MNRAQAIHAAIAELAKQGINNLKSREPIVVKENARLLLGKNERGWHLAFILDVSPEFSDYDMVLVDVHEPSGKIFVHGTI